MSNSMKGMIAGFIATSVVSAGILLLKSRLISCRDLNIMSLLGRIAGSTAFRAWTDHFIVGTLIWGLLFGGLRCRCARTCLLAEGRCFRRFAWLLHDDCVHAVRRAGFFGVKIGSKRRRSTLIYHVIYGSCWASSMACWPPGRRQRGPNARARPERPRKPPNALSMLQ